MTRLSRAGLVILGVLSLGDLAAPLLTDGEHPPMFIALIGAAIGAISIVLLILAWQGRTAAAIALVVVRLLSALTAVPAFIVPGVPAVPMILAGVVITMTLVGIGFVLAEPAVWSRPKPDDRRRSGRRRTGGSGCHALTHPRPRALLLHLSPPPGLPVRTSLPDSLLLSLPHSRPFPLLAEQHDDHCMANVVGPFGDYAAVIDASRAQWLDGLGLPGSSSSAICSARCCWRSDCSAPGRYRPGPHC